jgi:hypothetical protein
MHQPAHTFGDGFEHESYAFQQAGRLSTGEREFSGILNNKKTGYRHQPVDGEFCI